MALIALGFALLILALRTISDPSAGCGRERVVDCRDV